MSNDSETPAPGGQFLVYQAEDGKLKIDVRFEGETVWLTQQHMAELFQTTQQNISLHLRNIFAEGELQLDATHKESLSVRQEGGRTVRRRVDFYNLDAILSVGYRVKSGVATRFRIWATQRLREYIVKGFLLDDERLKYPFTLSGLWILLSCGGPRAALRLPWAVACGPVGAGVAGGRWPRVPWLSQGCAALALGYRMWPRWGRGMLVLGPWLSQGCAALALGYRMWPRWGRRGGLVVVTRLS